MSVFEVKICSLIRTISICSNTHWKNFQQTVDSGLIPGRVKPMTAKLVFTVSLLDVQQLKEQCDACVYGRQVAAWLEDLKVH